MNFSAPIILFPPVRLGETFGGFSTFGKIVAGFFPLPLQRVNCCNCPDLTQAERQREIQEMMRRARRAKRTNNKYPKPRNPFRKLPSGLSSRAEGIIIGAGLPIDREAVWRALAADTFRPEAMRNGGKRTVGEIYRWSGFMPDAPSIPQLIAALKSLPPDELDEVLDALS